MTTLQHDLLDALAAFRLSATPDGDRLRIEHGAGRKRRVASLDLAPLAEALDARPAQRRASLAGFASGVSAAIKEPHDPLADAWTFVEAAARVVPAIEHACFELGVAAAREDGAKPWTLPFPGDLRVAYYLELDRGVRVVTEPQFDAWGATRDRVTCAARSLLYHKTGWDTLLQLPLDDTGAHADAYRLGDGYDAARALILADLDYNRMRRGAIFALPHPDLLLLTDGDAPAATLDAFRAAVARHHDEARYPLTTTLFTWRDARELEVWPG